MPILVIIARNTGGHTGGGTDGPTQDIWYSSVPDRGDPRFKPTPMPSSRSSLSAAPLGPGLIGVFGGRQLVWQEVGAYYFNDIDYNEVYNHDSNTWTVRAPMPYPLSGVSAAPLGPGLAGVFGAGHTLVYNYDSDTWTTGNPTLTNRDFLATAPLGQGLVGVFGGLLLGGISTNLNGVYNYDSDTWALRTPMPTGRYSLAAATLGPGLVGAFGGLEAIDNGDNSVSVYTKDVNEVYNHDSDTWTVRTPMPYPLYGVSAAPLGPGLAGVFGTNHAAFPGGPLVYDYASDTWAIRGPMPTPRAYLAAAELGEGIVATVGGEEYANFIPLSVNEVYVY